MFWDLYAHFKGTVGGTTETVGTVGTVEDAEAKDAEATEDNAEAKDTEDAEAVDNAEKEKTRATMAFRTDPLVHELCERLGPHAFSTGYGRESLYRMNRISNVLLPFAKIEWEVVEVDTIGALLSLIQEYESKTTGLRERRVELESAIRQWPVRHR